MSQKRSDKFKKLNNVQLKSYKLIQKLPHLNQKEYLQNK